MYFSFKNIDFTSKLLSMELIIMFKHYIKFLVHNGIPVIYLVYYFSFNMDWEKIYGDDT